MPIAALLCALLLSPFLYHFLTDTINGIYPNRPHYHPNDLLSFFIPEPFMQFITPFTVKLSHNFVGNSPEHGAYLGLPLLLILLLFAWHHWRRAGTKYLLILTLIYAILSLSATWYFNGNKLFVLFFSHWFFYWLPGLKYSLACRYSLYTSFVVAIIVALWLASHPTTRLVSAAKYLLVLLALVVLLPCIKPMAHLHPDSIYPAYTQLDDSKTFFSKAQLYKKWLQQGENVLIIPSTAATWAQLQSNFYFKIAAAYLGPPPLVARWPPIFKLIDQRHPNDSVTAKQFSQFLTQRQIAAVIITDDHYQAIQKLLQSLAYQPIHVGGVWLYSLTKESHDN
ncbi:MAG: hypothetical protein GY821_10815 [Gammaproteobacteria bacterium]|nr:hypothetical protein [Gammaproteobacteria bacterium]